MTQAAKIWSELISKVKNYILKANSLLPRKKSSRMYVITGSGVLVVILALSAIMGASSSSEKNPTIGTFAVREGNLTISVTESGSIKARNAKDIKCEVEGQTTITSIVPEGTYIRPQDVNNKILVELDSSTLQEKCNQQEITFATSKASYTDANEAFLIQRKQNESDVSTDRLNLQFALLDLQKYLGESVAAKLLESAGNGTDPNCDIAMLVDDPDLGGEALQKLRETQSAINLADAQLKQAQSKLGWTQKLFEKKYVAGDELEGDRLTEKSNAISLDKAKTAMDLFRRYEFPKEARKLFSDYVEAGRKLERTEAQAIAKLAQAEAKLVSAKATYELQADRLEKLKKQLAACVIRAPSPGLVVYEDPGRRRGDSPIEVGASIRERQTIMSLPDTAEMSVEIKIHESSVDKVRPGMPAKITVDSLPDTTFTGKVIKIAPLPDQRNSWLNPDLKVYLAEVSIDQMHESLRQGKSAKVEIIVDQLKNVIYVPVLSVCNQGGKKVCYLAGSPPQPVTVATGSFNDNFVQIVSGLSAGQVVLLNPPAATQAEKGIPGAMTAEPKEAASEKVGPTGANPPATAQSSDESPKRTLSMPQDASAKPDNAPRQQRRRTGARAAERDTAPAGR